MNASSAIIILIGLVTVINGQDPACPPGQSPFKPNLVPVACDPVAPNDCPANVLCSTVPTNPAPFQSLCCLNIPVTCQATEVQVMNRCYPLLNPNGFFCYFAEQCTGNSVCTDYVCRCPATLSTVVNNVCTPSTTTTTTTTTTTRTPVVCTGNTVLIGGRCIQKTNDSVCLNVNCLSTGAALCGSYAPYTRCGYNAGQANYFCCQ